MRSIMVLNPKGGSGKSTISTSLASYYADQGKSVVLCDLDPQGSAKDWLEARSAGRPPILGITGWGKNASRPPRTADVVIYDAPAGAHGKDLTALLRKADSFIIPVLPSPIDMRAASHFIAELKRNSRVVNKQAKYAVVANKAREYTVIYAELEDFLKKQKVPVVTTLRDSMNYVRAAERGLGIFELAPYATVMDRDQWKPLISWLNSKRSH